MSLPHLAVGALLLACGLAIFWQTNIRWPPRLADARTRSDNLWRLWFRVWGAVMVLTSLPIMIGIVDLNLATRIGAAEVVAWIFGEAAINLALAAWKWIAPRRP